MVVHLPNGNSIPLFGSNHRWDVRKEYFSTDNLKFWQWQENTADAMWEIALQLPDWPPESPKDIERLIRVGWSWGRRNHNYKIIPSMLLDAFRPISFRIKNGSDQLLDLLDAQLLISAQTESAKANSLYGASALDLPRRGVRQFEGGIGVIAESLVTAIRNNGGQVIFRERVIKIKNHSNGDIEVFTSKKNSYQGQLLVLNLSPANISSLGVEFNHWMSVRHKLLFPKDAWGAFTVYLGLSQDIIPDKPYKEFPTHHQIIRERPLGEGNSIFISISPKWDLHRSPFGKRAATISTHTKLDAWWELFNRDRDEYENLKKVYTEKIFKNVERILPSIREASDLILPGTPITFQRFTQRNFGWVGGFPQTSLLSAWPARINKNMWMVGDSIFPGQSIAAVSLGGLRVARKVMEFVQSEN
jgi:phytoene dehydrogenase-like protein